MSQENVEAVRRQHDHFRQTGEVLPEIYDSDAEWMAAREDPDAATHRGLEAIRGYFAQWTEMFEVIDFRTEELIDAGDKVFAWFRFSGRGITSGAPVETEQAQIWTFRDGKVVRVEEDTIGREARRFRRPERKVVRCTSQSFTRSPIQRSSGGRRTRVSCRRA